MGFFKLAGMTIGGLFKKPETLKYPFETKKPYPGQKGVIKHIDAKACNLCGICSKRCPCHAIEVDRIKKTWSINHLQCIQCGYCTQSCPKKCLNMDGARPEVVASKHLEIIDIPMEPKKPATTASKPAAVAPKSSSVTPKSSVTAPDSTTSNQKEDKNTTIKQDDNNNNPSTIKDNKEDNINK